MDLSSLTALILAGGLGTRLRSLVPDQPKGLAPVADRPFLEYQVAWLAEQGIRQIVLCLGYRSQQIIQHFGDGSPWGVHIRYSVEPTPLGTGGALKLAQQFVGERFLAMNGDTYFLDAVGPILQQHETTGALLTIGVSAAGPSSASGQIHLDRDRRILRFAEKSTEEIGGWLSAGLYVAQPRLLSMIPDQTNVSLEKETFSQLLKRGEPVFGYPLTQGFIDMGTPAGYAQLAQHLHSSDANR